MLRSVGLLLSFIVMSLGGGITPHQSIYANVTPTSVSPAITAEGNDYATDVLGNAWDMNEYSDISKYLNTSGVTINLDSIQVQNGIFSARSTNTDAYFFPLFPGYGAGSINLGGYGVNYPINSAKYHCLYFRMKVNTTANDEIRVFWFADTGLTDNNNWGVSKIIPPVPNQWNIYSIDLNTIFDSSNGYIPWTGNSRWEGLRIDPTRYSSVNFSVDWIRLTDCTARNVTVSWTPVSSQVEIWMGKTSNSLETKLVGPLSGSTGSAVLDTQGWEAGDYYIGVKNLSNNNVQWSTLHVEPKPKITITKPSFTSGEGITWNMNSASEILTGPSTTRCVIYSFINGILNMQTLSPSAIGQSCTASGYSDPQIFLKLPSSQIDPTQYRYLSYRLNMQGSWQNVNKGWIFRWLWRYYKSGDPNHWCINVTHDIPFDVGWETYSLDMFNPAMGTPEYAVGAYSSDCNPVQSWSQNPINELRFDPNENATSASFYQQMDWISLNKMDRVSRGQVFPITIVPSKPIGDLTLTFYYTTDANQPKQHSVVLQQTKSAGNAGPNKLFLPLIQNQANTMPLNGIPYNWDTSTVSQGVYYICVESRDTVGNVSMNCSQAPVQVY
jgi:hypothetical protein